MSCGSFRNHLAGYLDDALTAEESHAIGRHLVTCADCRAELRYYRHLREVLLNLPRVAAPGDLSLAIRVLASRQRRSWWVRYGLAFENILRPLAVPTATGVLTTLVVFAILIGTFFGGMPRGEVVGDVPLALATPPQLISAGPSELNTIDDTVVIEVRVDAQGKAGDYRVLSGPESPGVGRQLDQLLILSRFNPATAFGVPTTGRLILSFRRVNVRG
jgi:anti-sigma factor RsiW